MRPVHEITSDEENFRTEELIPGDERFLISRRDPVEPEPVGTIVIMAFKIVGYDQDCDGSLMARLEHIDKNGDATGWCPKQIGLYPETGIVVTQKEWAGLFNQPA